MKNWIIAIGLCLGSFLIAQSPLPSPSGGLTGAGGTCSALGGDTTGPCSANTLVRVSGVPNATALQTDGSGNISNNTNVVTSAATQSNQACTTGAGGKAIQTPSTNCTVDSSGNVAVNTLRVGSNPATCTPGTSPCVALNEGTAPSVCAASGVDCIYADSTAHCIEVSYNNGSYSCLSTAADSVPSSRTISTTSPLGGGGDLSANRTLTCTTCVAASSPGAGIAHFAGSTQTVTSSAVVSADLNITTSTCAAPALLSAISAGGVGTCITPVLTESLCGSTDCARSYTLVLADAGKSLVHPASDNNARTYTIPANGSAAIPQDSCVTFINYINTVTIAITTDTMTLMGANTTGSRTLAAGNWATACKMGSTTTWVIGGSSGLT